MLRPESPATAARHHSWSRDLILLAAIFALLFGLRLGSPPLANPDEGRYAEVPREMVASGDWVTPRLDGVVYFEKPPLMYWAVAVCLEAFGPSEWSMRLAPALFALGGVLLTYAAGRRLLGRDGGLAAAIVLGSSLLYFALGRILILDMAVSVLMTATLFCFILGVREAAGRRRRWFFYGLYASAALATLTKGLIGFLLPGLVMFLWLLIFNQWKRLRPLYLPTGLLLFLAIAVPWHVLAELRHPGWAHFYFIHEHWERYTTTTHGRYEPFWYFIPVVIFGFFPWTGFLWPALRREFARGVAERNEKADAWFLVTWAVVIFVFYSASQSKLIPYILPVFPPLAVLIGGWLGDAQAAREAVRKMRNGLGFFAFCCGVLGAAMVVIVLRPAVIHDAAQAAALRPFAAVLGIALLVGGVVTPWLAKWRGLRAGLGGLVMTIAVLYGGLMLAQTHIARPSTKELAFFVRAHARPGDRVVHYHDFFHDFTFYAERLVDVVSGEGELELGQDPAARASGRFIDDAEFRRRWEGPARLWVVARRRDVTELFADTTFHYHLLAETPGHYLFSNRP